MRTLKQWLLERHRQFERSVSQKYSLGYFLLTGLLILTSLVALFTLSRLGDGYQTMLDDLLDLNTLYVQVEESFGYVDDYYLYLRDSSRDAYHEQAVETEAQLELLLNQMRVQYSRDETDLCYMVQTFLERCDLLLVQVEDYIEGNGVTHLQLEETYAQVQEIVSFINISFKEIYSDKLVLMEHSKANLVRFQTFAVCTMILLLVLGLFICTAFYQKVLNGLTLMLKKLTDFVTKQTGSTDPDGEQHILLPTNDELSLLADSFNHMLDTIRAQIKQLEESNQLKQQLQQSEIERLQISHDLQKNRMILLQSRVNPHFLFNTLSMIDVMAQMENADQTAHLIEITAEYLRYNLEQITKAVTLSDELDNLRNYVYIQECRFGDRYTFHFEVDPECNSQCLPCMVLQPLVENCIQHAIKDMASGGVVTVRTLRRGQRFVLQVEDNGVGIPPAQLKELLASLNNKELSDKHIGVRNIYMRLMYFFHSDMEFSIESVPGKTLVSISLPFSDPETSQQEGCMPCIQ